MSRKSPYKEEYCKQIVEFAKQGKNLTAFADSIGVIEARLCDWAKRHPEFEEARAMAKQSLKVYYENFTMAAAAGKIKNCKPELVKLLAAKYAGMYATPDTRVIVEVKQVAEDL